MKNLDSLSCAAHGAQRGNGQISAHLPHPLRLPAEHTSLLPTPPALPWDPSSPLGNVPIVLCS